MFNMPNLIYTQFTYELLKKSIHILLKIIVKNIDDVIKCYCKLELLLLQLVLKIFK